MPQSQVTRRSRNVPFTRYINRELIMVQIADHNLSTSTVWIQMWKE